MCKKWIIQQISHWNRRGIQPELWLQKTIPKPNSEREKKRDAEFDPSNIEFSDSLEQIWSSREETVKDIGKYSDERQKILLFPEADKEEDQQVCKFKDID